MFAEPKSRAGRRKIPVAAVLRDILVEHTMTAAGELVLGRSDGQRPFNDTSVAKRALNAWRRAGLEPITLHEARHTFASLMIAAGVNARALTSYMGHASVTITYDRYGHLMPGNEDEAAASLTPISSAPTHARGWPRSISRRPPPRFANPSYRGSLCRQLCASQHANQWTSVDSHGLKDDSYKTMQTRMVERKAEGGEM